eukprot:TRINITY_DN13631_c0_g1_i1.p1 TRINITY_DN13631_c0_g1~~TRINITY_DN13631_c0_g1_i1.p1  ORF type:complete len:246 (-),score=30.01 TRINITY_DN13631_c0_g1_i1:8-745(-)
MDDVAIRPPEAIPTSAEPEPVEEDLRLIETPHAEIGSLERVDISRALGAALLMFWLLLLAACLIFRRVGSSILGLSLLEVFYRIGSIIFGGGQVVLPMLLADVVEPGWVTSAQFFNGFAIVSSLPGPVFNFSAYLGAVADGFLGSVLSWVGLFAPGFIIFVGILPFWKAYRELSVVQKGLKGVNAVAIGLVIAAVYLLWEKAITTPQQASIVITVLCSLLVFDQQSPIAILIGATQGLLYEYIYS